ncbi:hypothetical protein GCM10027194_16200 [Thalassiella azotivora]
MVWGARWCGALGESGDGGPSVAIGWSGTRLKRARRGLPGSPAGVVRTRAPRTAPGPPPEGTGPVPSFVHRQVVTARW